jgi:serine/threonine protein kinase
MPGTFRGKLSYMSPEQASGDELDARSDQFALGIVGWGALHRAAALPRRLAHEDDAPADGGRHQRPRSLRPDLPEALEQIVLRMLRSRREDRFPDCQEVAQALDGVTRRGDPIFDLGALVLDCVGTSPGTRAHRGAGAVRPMGRRRHGARAAPLHGGPLMSARCPPPPHTHLRGLVLVLAAAPAVGQAAEPAPAAPGNHTGPNGCVGGRRSRRRRPRPPCPPRRALCRCNDDTAFDGTVRRGGLPLLPAPPRSSHRGRSRGRRDVRPHTSKWSSASPWRLVPPSGCNSPPRPSWSSSRANALSVAGSPSPTAGTSTTGGPSGRASAPTFWRTTRCTSTAWPGGLGF